MYRVWIRRRPPCVVNKGGAAGRPLPIPRYERFCHGCARGGRPPPPPPPMRCIWDLFAREQSCKLDVYHQGLEIDCGFWRMPSALVIAIVWVHWLLASTSNWSLFFMRYIIVRIHYHHQVADCDKGE